VSLFWHPRFFNDPPIACFHALMLQLFREAPAREGAA
jgi:hypothetical protein